MKEYKTNINDSILLGTKIRRLRMERKLVQRELAEQVEHRYANVQQDRVGCTPCETIASGAIGEAASCEREGTANPLACRWCAQRRQG